MTLKPLSIKKLRKFYVKFDAWTSLGKDYEGTEEEFANASTDALVELALFCVEGDRPDLAEKDEEGDPKALEVFDQLTVFRIIEICAGIKLNDPKLMKMAMEAAEQVGTS